MADRVRLQVRDPTYPNEERWVDVGDPTAGFEALPFSGSITGSVLPTGAATSANQTTLIGKITDLISENIHTSEDELRVYEANHICTANTSNTPLGAGATFTGSWQDCLHYQEVNVSVVSDQNSALNGLVIEWSDDGVVVGDSDVFSVYANAGTNYTPNPAFRYVRVSYTNGATPQGTFHLMTILRRNATGGSFHRIDSTLKDDSDARLNLSVPKLKTAANTYVSQTATAAGNAKMSLEELESGISTNSNSQLKTTIYDEEGGDVDVDTIVDSTTNLDGKNGLVTASVLFGRVSDTKFLPLKLDPSTQSIQIIDYEHHEIHSGSHYFVVGVQDLSVNQVLDFTWLMPNTTTWIHWTFEIDTEDETSWYVYENAVATNPLDNAVTPLNSNRNSLSTSATTMKYEIQTNLTAANADTSVATATLLMSGQSGSKTSSNAIGAASRSNEIIMKQNTLYCLRAVATAAGYINFKMEWYEHADAN